MDALDIPERDRFQIITEHDTGTSSPSHDADRLVALDAGFGFGFERTDGLVVIQVLTRSGRSDR
ncbi:4-oxalocrotonate tautomerase [Streptomyces hygroscopicus subsp. jinggangensis 5008]|nr:4-oxalocrotonate tautomerase [Streptomyces hygroscopicus subsp. jinggangensis 5008]AGF62058.1 4-oxalocrotonate tautomerase [Streptomyces hygroscopicus subsp. jinggangensis TL01]